MGICKCKRRTDLYCYVHNKPVCDNCIVDHGLCHVRTYPEWLASSEYPPPSCAKCHQSLVEGEKVIRLNCLEMFHPHCIDAHLKSFGLDRVSTAGCPSCNVSLLPSANDTSALAESIRSALEQLPSAPVIPRPSSVETQAIPTATAHTFSTPSGTSKTSRIRETAGASSSSSVPSTPAAVTTSKSTADPSSFPGRKMTHKGSSRSIEIPMADADDNKYGRQTLLDKVGVTRALKRLALMQQTPGFNRKVALAAGVFALIFIVYLIVSSLSEEEDLVKIN